MNLNYNKKKPVIVFCFYFYNYGRCYIYIDYNYVDKNTFALYLCFPTRWVHDGMVNLSLGISKSGVGNELLY